jgi:hypothetical protein
MPDTNKLEERFEIRRPQEASSRTKPDAAALASLLNEWMQGDQIEQMETFEILRRTMDEDRPEGYKLFS